MDTSDLSKRIKSADLYLINVEGEADRNGTGHLFVGSLEEFFDAAKAFGATVIFLCTSKLEEKDFRHAWDSYEDDTIDDEGDDSNDTQENSESFDLTDVLPSLAEFKKHVGQEYAFLLTAKSQLGVLNFYSEEAWWAVFEQQKEKAIRKFDDNHEAEREKIEEQKTQKEESLLKQARSLLDDPEFA